MFRERFPTHREGAIGLDTHVWFVLTSTSTEMQSTHSALRIHDSTLLSKESLLLVSGGI